MAVTKRAESAPSEAKAAADAVGVEVVEAADPRALVALLAEVWSTPVDRFQLGPELVRALTAAGNYAAVAVDGDGEVIGASLGFLGLHDGEMDLHSHITAARAGAPAGVGYALKLHQRAWALDRGIATVRWTFDPLVRRNAWFNLAKLGAGIAEYHRNFYGAMADAVNAGDESDRCLAVWDLDGPRATAAVAGTRQDVQQVPAGALLVETPEDIVALRASDPAAGVAWRMRLREELGDPMAKGYVVVGITRSGAYVLLKP